ncbi:Uncharacterised protein [Legionella steigerwaltii]|uniref:Uncharacterized protein n=1 Tax=Legionella steigerwaltii TaxID=460 RepID=A0A378L7K7_9GAMM|nr:hypothetical protein [Legionella steigerwaltii]KTD77745.1 hypothetical protein Lstg_2102 [Legionella steigerwaltii]STY23055.1 Uncharacterised protein [Legionella steigerwaltii]
MQSKSEKKYEAVVLVKDSGGPAGPGHVSVTFVKKEEGGTPKKSHTSFFPGAFGSILTGLSFGSIPVLGQVEKNPEVDFKEANHVLRKEITKEEYKKGTATQDEFHKDTTTGKNVYAVFGTANPISEVVCDTYCKSHVEGDAFSGIPPEMERIAEKPEIHNCASSVTKVLKGSGLHSFSNPIIPTFFTQELKQHGFEEVDKKAMENIFK